MGSLCTWGAKKHFLPKNCPHNFFQLGISCYIPLDSPCWVESTGTLGFFIKLIFNGDIEEKPKKNSKKIFFSKIWIFEKLKFLSNANDYLHENKYGY